MTDSTALVRLFKHAVKTIATNYDLENVLKQIINTVSEVTAAESCNIYLFNNTTNALTLVASKIQTTNRTQTCSLKIGEGLTGWVAQHKKPLIINNNAPHDARFKKIPALQEDSYESFFAAPIIYHGELHGVFNLQHQLPHVFTDDEILMLSLITDLIGGPITIARLISDSQRSDKQVQSISRISEVISSSKYLDESLFLISTISAEMMNSHVCSIMLLDPSGKTLSMTATQTLSETFKSKPDLKAHQGISGRTIATRKPIIIKDVTKDADFMFPDIAKKEQLCSMLSVPMQIKDRIIGVINIYTKEPYDFTEKDITVMQAVAHQTAIAIENTQLIAETEKTREALATRKLIDRAKGILMEENKLTESQAYTIIHKKAMDTRRSMKEIADAIITAKEIRDMKS